MEKEYVGNVSGYCPKCGVEIAPDDWCGSEIDFGEVHFYFTCHNCGGAGCETYLMEYASTNLIIDEK
jgi:predicted RNA-binding Zn-ribbon protein involved in translation (DUF1610 family)